MNHAPGPHRIELIVLDWDGTVADSEARIVGAIEDAIAEVGAEAGLARPACHPREVIGLSRLEAIEALYPRDAPAISDRLLSAWQARWLAATADPVELFAGVFDAVSRLKEAGYSIAVATGKSRRGLDRELAESGLGRFVDASRCADEAPSKPHPAMLEAVIEMLDATPEATLMVGDTVYDLDMARRVGVRSIAVRTGVHTARRLLEFEPLAILDSVADLPQYLEPPARA